MSPIEHAHAARITACYANTKSPYDHETLPDAAPSVPTLVRALFARLLPPVPILLAWLGLSQVMSGFPQTVINVLAFLAVTWFGAFCLPILRALYEASPLNDHTESHS